MIPKIIHQFKWKDRDKKQFVLNVKNSNKKWKHKVWTLEDVKKTYDLAPANFKQKLDYFIERGMELHAQDIAKFWILFSEGGIYIDNEFKFKPRKSLNHINFGDNELILFNGDIRQNSWRIQESVMASCPRNKFIAHLIDYIGHSDYFPRSQWDGSLLEVYSSTYITTHYDLYTRLCNSEEAIRKSILSITNADRKKIPENHVVMNPRVAFWINPEMVLRHTRETNIIHSTGPQV